VTTRNRGVPRPGLAALAGLAGRGGGTGAGGPQRRTAFLRGMTRRRLGAGAAVIRGDFTEEAGVNAARELLAGPALPTAVFAANDLVAAGLLGGFDQAGVDVPDDVSIVGYDNISIAHLAHVSLTTVHQPRSAMGQMALELLLDRIDNRRASIVRVVEPSLVVRSTTGPPRAGGLAPRRRRSRRPTSNRSCAPPGRCARCRAVNTAPAAVRKSAARPA